jgi:hypothetical protein
MSDTINLAQVERDFQEPPDSKELASLADAIADRVTDGEMSEAVRLLTTFRANAIARRMAQGEGNSVPRTDDVD